MLGMTATPERTDGMPVEFARRQVENAKANEPAKLLDSFPSLTGDRGSFIRTGSEDLAMGTSPFATKE